MKYNSKKYSVNTKEGRGKGTVKKEAKNTIKLID